MQRRAVVIGAGIAGLAAAQALAHLEFEVCVLERDDRLRSEGAGLTLWPNAVRALEAVGLGEVVAECGRTVSEAVTLTPAGSLLTAVPLDRIAEHFGPLVGVHRADLLAALAARVEGEVRFGAEVIATGGALRTQGQPIEADVIVAADGIGSAAREAVAPGVALRAAGYSAWRGVAQSGDRTPARASEAMGRGRRFGLVPLPGGRTYWFAVLDGGDGCDRLEAAFADWHEPIPEILAATPAADRSYLPLQDLPRLPRWHRDELVLVGDAAHAMTPNLGQGAAQALEDVAALVRRLEEAPLPQALRAYERDRKRRAERIARQSRAMGRLAQAANPIVAGARDFLARHVPPAVAFRQMQRLLEG